MTEETPTGTFQKGSDLLPEGYQPPDPREKIKVVGVRARDAARPVYHLMDGLCLRVGDKVVTESAAGEAEWGEVVESPRVLEARYVPGPLGKVLRRASEEEVNRVARAVSLEARAKALCLEKIKEFDLPMRLIDVKYAFSNQKATFFFSAEGRVDFRRLVRALAEQLSVRVEMRQMGARDEAGMIGGCGDCGRQYCCSTFLKAFDPISVRMAKDQNLSLNPSKLSGGCGRLKCCLRFEHSHYLAVKKTLPACKKKVGGCNCGATVIRQDLLKEEITLALETGDRLTVHSSQLTRLPTGQFALKTPMEVPVAAAKGRPGGRE
ncbi:MAG: stage 0 sporulation protein [Candidatus Tectomicrobia bacterium]|uniref:Stage 0 sporulation protein n=1 Tax=Tectimicrobiota bacterium TaxID=2528274 RepID=A0A932HXZ1_UNCTE|nr:stage 0 sporulation protein [Candidatus Tectomicrobia bacterium]